MFNTSCTSSASSCSKETLLKQAEAARNQRQTDKKKYHSAILIQSLVRGHQARKLHHTELLQKLQLNLNETKLNTGSQSTSSDLYELTKIYLFLERFSSSKNLPELVRICAHLAISIQSGDFKHSYVSLILSKTLYQGFLVQSKRIIRIALREMTVFAAGLKVKEDFFKFEILLNFVWNLASLGRWKCFKAAVAEKKTGEMKSVNDKLVATLLTETTKAYLALLQTERIYSIFNASLIQHLNNHKLILNDQNLICILNLSIQILQSSNYAHKVLAEFASEILTVPAVVQMFLGLKGVQTEMLLNECNLSCRLYPLLSNKEAISFIEETDFLQAISFLGNLCSIELLDFPAFKLNVDNFLLISTELITHSSNLLQDSKSHAKTNQKQSTSITYTPLFGYMKLHMTNALSFEDLLSQLRFLWSHKFILLLFMDSKQSDSAACLPANTEVNQLTKANFKSFLQAFFDRSTGQQRQMLNSRGSMGVYRVCSFYKKILVLFSEPKIEILSALSFEEAFLTGLWKYFSGLGPMCGLKELVKIVDKDKSFVHPIFDVLFVLASLVLYLFTIFDEEEVFTKQKFFTRDDFRLLAKFLNHFLYEVITCLVVDTSSGGSQIAATNLEKNNYFILFHQLLLVIYDKDCKQNNMDQMENFWVIKDIKIKNLTSELSRGKSSLCMILAKIPHVIPLKLRIEIMQAEILRDKERLEYANVRIKVRRTRLIEDGIDQINSLPSLKSTIRVKMVNEFGLSEAGIDQDGVFKEFLLDVIKKILNPEFNLFQVTSEQQLYPSSSSYFIEDHLKMFEFVGKLIGKAVYEGHVIDVHFAPFFLRQIIGCHQRSSNYSFVDDLATSDKELYKNLKSIKDSDFVEELELSFTHSELHLGKLVESELVPNGAEIKVTNDNKIRYIHLLAHHKLHKQIREQIVAFDRGFKSVIKQDWLTMFTLTEVQTLISGSVVDLDLDDLRENVQYWGGLHAHHRIIKWLFEVLEHDFDGRERSLFLKFVTSSARPPLLGFASLNPQFTIRSVENNEEDGTIYDASFKSFFKTMLNIGNDKDTQRLPTSSTCFNLLKLPNYSRKSTLRERLRYAITSNSGFELS